MEMKIKLKIIQGFVHNVIQRFTIFVNIAKKKTNARNVMQDIFQMKKAYVLSVLTIA